MADLSGPKVSTWEEMAFGLLPAVSRSIDLASVDVIHANGQDTAMLGAVLKLQHNIPCNTAASVLPGPPVMPLLGGLKTI